MMIMVIARRGGPRFNRALVSTIVSPGMVRATIGGAVFGLVGVALH